MTDKFEIAAKWIELGYPTSTILRIVMLSRSTYYHRKSQEFRQQEMGSRGGRPIPGYSWLHNDHKVCDADIKQWILRAVEGDGAFYGYKKLTYELRRKHGIIINKKKVYRMCTELDILRPQRRIKVKHPRRISQNWQITGSNQLWQTDIKYGYIASEKRFFYVLSIIDVYDRSIVADYIGLNCTAKDAAATLREALRKRQNDFRGRLPVIRSDNGPQFVSHHYETECKRIEVHHELIPFKSPNKNAYIESYHSILEDECLGRHEFTSYLQAYEAVTRFKQFYNQRRIHSGVKYRTPSEFYQEHVSNHAKLLPIAV